MKEYTINIDTQLKKLKIAKKKSFKDMDEDSIYVATINEYLKQMEVFKKQSDEYLVSIEDFKTSPCLSADLVSPRLQDVKAKNPAMKRNRDNFFMINLIWVIILL